MLGTNGRDEMPKNNDDLGVWFNACGTWVIAICFVLSLLRAEKAIHDMQQANKNFQAEMQKATNGIKGIR